MRTVFFKTTLTTLFYLAVFSAGFLLMSAKTIHAQVDFIRSTIAVNHRSSPVRGQTTFPGFNPCDSLTATSTNCPITTAGPLLSKFNIDPTPSATTGLFSLTGPGAITDNMFGIVEDVSANPGLCGLFADDGARHIGAGELNCGEIRVDPWTQGVGILAFMASGQGGHINIDIKFNGDFSGAETPGTTHTAFNFENLFHWDAVNWDAGFPTAALVPDTTCTAAPTIQVGACMHINQLTTLGATGGHGTAATEFPTVLSGTPAFGDQLFSQSANWGAGSDGANAFDGQVWTWSAQVGFGFSENVPGATKTDLKFSQSVKQPGMSGSTGTFEVTADQQFPINDATAGTLLPVPDSTMPTGKFQTICADGGFCENPTTPVDF